MMSPAEVLAPEATLCLQLLDSSHSYPVQTWKLKGQTTIRIGRSDDNEVVVHQPSVSRLHAMLHWTESGWELVNVGRFGTIQAGAAVGQTRLDRDTTIQLGPSGPSLRVLLSGVQGSHGETREHAVVSVHQINESLKQRKVAEIVESDFFRELQKRAKQIKKEDGGFDPERTV